MCGFSAKAFSAKAIDEDGLSIYKVSDMRYLKPDPSPKTGAVVSSMRGSGLSWSRLSYAHFAIEDNAGGPGSR